MLFRTELNIPESAFKINHNHHLMGLGSCFVDTIGQKLIQSKFQILSNPFGTIFQPLAIENAVSRIHSMTYYSQDEIFHHRELYFSWDHHTSFSNATLRSTLDNINNSLENAGEFARLTDVFFITLGTAWAYKLKGAEVFVSNCHKVPSDQFDKILLNDSQIKTSLRNTYQLLLDLNPKAKIITSISPVRHTKDGLVENNISKSKLINALHETNSQFENVYYFPSYELMMDDLRDYRFYKEDLIHPSEMAVDYIWKKFTNTYFDEETKEKIKTVQKINVAANHRAINTQTISYKQFLYNSLKNIESLESQFPKGSFDKEKENFKNLMRNAD